jgi:antitoxin CptB
MDLVLGRFADAQIGSLNDIELDEIDRWLEVPDQQIFAWVNGMEPVPAEYDTPLFLRLAQFQPQGCGVSAAGKSPAGLLKTGKPLTLSQVADGAEGPGARRSRACDRCKKGRAGHFARRHLPRRAANGDVVEGAVIFCSRGSATGISGVGLPAV